MTGYACRPGLFNCTKVGNERRMRRVALAAVFQGKMWIVATVMTGRTLRNSILSFRWVRYMAIQTGDIVFMGGFLPGKGPDHLNMTFEAVLFCQGLLLDCGHGNRSEPVENYTTESRDKHLLFHPYVLFVRVQNRNFKQWVAVSDQVYPALLEGGIDYRLVFILPNYAGLYDR